MRYSQEIERTSLSCKHIDLNIILLMGVFLKKKKRDWILG